MPRRAFVSDLQKAKEGPLPANIHDLDNGEEDGSITFLHKPPGQDAPAFTIQALVPGKFLHRKTYEVC